MKEHKLLRILRLIPCACFLLLVLYYGATNLLSVKNMVMNASFSGLAEFTNGFESGLSGNFRQKNDYINLHGAFVKWMGINDLNEVQRLENGYLVSGTDYFASEALADDLQQLSAYARERDMGFLCVPVPRKKEFYGVQPSPGHESKYGEMADFLSMLKDRNVNVLDMNLWFEENGWGIEDTYLVTDHHWRPEAAFAAMGQIMTWYGEHCDVVCDPDTLNLENWHVEVYEDWMLGSWGLRTGVWYGGLDDLSYIYPKFETQISANRITQEKQRVPHLEHTVYDTQYLTQPNTFDAWPYCLYMGGDYPMVYLQNPLAVNQKKILVVGDSFRLPLECFLTTQFSELFHIDMRYYQDGTFLEYLTQIDPDLLLVCFSGCEEGPKHAYGLEEWNQSFVGKVPRRLEQKENIRLDTTEQSRNRYLLEANMAPGAYEIAVDGVTLERRLPVEADGPGEFVQASVVDLNTNQVKAVRYFLADYPESQKWLFTLPEDAAANYGLFLCNGTDGYTQGNTVGVEMLTISRYE